MGATADGLTGQTGSALLSSSDRERTMPNDQRRSNHQPGLARLAHWRSRHLTMRKIVALLVLASFMAPGVAVPVAALL
jgi:hypothetical protein